jgi:phosphoenolpyruvate carboxylase
LRHFASNWEECGYVYRMTVGKSVFIAVSHANWLGRDRNFGNPKVRHFISKYTIRIQTWAALPAHQRMITCGSLPSIFDVVSRVRMISERRQNRYFSY